MQPLFKKIKIKKMKKLFVSMLAMADITTATNAQETKIEKSKPAQEKKVSKEEKDAMKAKKEADLVEAFKSADFTAEQQTKAREIMDEAAKKGKELKANTTLTEEERKAKNKEISDAKNAKLKELVGEAKFKAFQRVQKMQKEAAKAPATAPVKE